MLCVFGMLAALRASVSFMPSDCHARDGYNHKQEFLFSLLILGIYPVSFLAYFMLGGYAGYMSVSPVYDAYIQKKFPKLIAATVFGTYLILSLVCFILQSMHIPSFSV